MFINSLLFLNILTPILAIISVLSYQHYQHKIHATTISSLLITFNFILAVILFILYNFGTINFYNILSAQGAIWLSDFIDFYFYLWAQNQFSGFDLSLAYYNLHIWSDWISSGMLSIEWAFSLNSINTCMLIIVNLISALVHFYSQDYMLHDKNISKFFAYLSLFTFFMILLITGDNFLILFLGWEGVGLCSYLLISFWNTRIQANKAAIKALIVNRIADLALTIGILLVFVLTGSLVFDIVFSLLVEQDIYQFKFFWKSETFNTNPTLVDLIYDIRIISLITILLFIGAMGKSAQISLHTWLPDAMEGPTPVSALIHAATMVTAGVFLIIKCSPLFESVPVILLIITFVGALTAFVAASIGLIQNDIKKVIAYSTCSQLGYMIFACGLSNYHIAFFHLINHAFFKALLFLSAGAIIHSLSNEQDMRRYGGLFKMIPFTTTMLVIGSIALIGFPFLTGYYSKDVILEIAFAKYTIAGTFAYILGVLAAFGTTFYSFRIFYLTYFVPTITNQYVLKKTHELPKQMAIILSVLALGSLFFGYITKDLFIGLGSNFFVDTIYIGPNQNNQLQAEFLPQILKIGPLLLSMCAIFVVNFVFFKMQLTFILGRQIFRNIFTLLVFKWYFDWFYNKFINIFVLNLSVWFFKIWDKQLLEWLGPSGIGTCFYTISDTLKKIQTGNMQHYAFLFVYTLFIFIFELSTVNTIF